MLIRAAGAQRGLRALAQTVRPNLMRAPKDALNALLIVIGTPLASDGHLGLAMRLADSLLLEADALDRALDAVQRAARGVARGESPQPELVIPLIGLLRRSTHAAKVAELADVGPARREGDHLLAVMAETIGRLADSPTARRQFYHAARAFVALRRAALADARRTLESLRPIELPAESETRLRASWDGRADADELESIEATAVALASAIRPSGPPPARSLERPAAVLGIKVAS